MFSLTGTQWQVYQGGDLERGKYWILETSENQIKDLFSGKSRNYSEKGIMGQELCFWKMKPHSEIQGLDICCNMDGPRDYHAE